MTRTLCVAAQTSKMPRVPSNGAVPLPGSRTANFDPRWPAILTALLRLRDDGRRAVRVVDADCGDGHLLLHALRHARALGFTAIEGRGIDGSPALIGRARAAAALVSDAAIGVAFELADMVDALQAEITCPADIVLWRTPRPGNGQPAVADALARAGRLVISDAAPRGAAA